MSEGGLNLENAAGFLKGGDSGVIVVSGQPDSSLLIAAVEHRGPQMPPDQRLDEHQISTLRRWVSDGATWPSDTHLTRGAGKSITLADRDHWAFRPITSPAMPVLSDSSWVRQDLDRFVRAAQERRGTSPAPPADRITLLRRVHFDLTGLPPSPETLERFLNDDSEVGYEQLVDRLLSSREFGERWASFWLDVVRYAESDGYKQDSVRPHAWRYRDYVIQAFYEDRPFDRFIMEQLAGDLLTPVTDESLIATGYLRAWIYEYNQRDVVGQWTTILDDLTETTADAFLGIGLGCARCHDHKYDPLKQVDYFRLQACFTSLIPEDQVPLLGKLPRQAWEDAQNRFRQDHLAILQNLESIEAPIRREAEAAEIEKFPPDLRPHLIADPHTLDSLETQWVALARRQIDAALANIDFSKRLTGEELERWKQARAQWDAIRDQAPQTPFAFGVAELENALSHWPTNSDFSVAPGRPEVLTPPSDSPDFPQDRPRRLALAEWIVSPENPLTARVLVNRVWTRLFGEGLVTSSQDFGTLTPAPTEPELLDFLAHRFRDEGWSFRQLVRQIVLSSTYRQASYHPQRERMNAIDPLGSSWWQQSRRRLDAEQIRDTLLTVSEELNVRGDGPSQPGDMPVRSVYLHVVRNTPDPILSAFDFPDRIRSRTRRDVTITPQQALLLLNHPWVVDRVEAMAGRALSPALSSDENAVQQLFLRTLSRPATDTEISEISQWLVEARAARVSADTDPQVVDLELWIDLCHSLVNSGEFLHLD